MKPTVKNKVYHKRERETNITRHSTINENLNISKKATARRKKSCIIPKSRVPNLPNHAPTEVRHIPLVESKRFLTPREALQGLACKHAAVVTVLLLGCILRAS